MARARPALVQRQIHMSRKLLVLPDIRNDQVREFGRRALAMLCPEESEEGVGLILRAVRAS